MSSLGGTYSYDLPLSYGRLAGFRLFDKIVSADFDRVMKCHSREN